MPSLPKVVDPATDHSFFGHPRGLAVLFFAEMWERFSYYGMRALLIFYLTQHFLFSKEDAYVIYGAYTALVYIAPVIGGVLADRYLGARKAVVFGAVLLAMGHIGMALEGDATVADASGVIRDTFYLNAFYFSLSFIIVGSGFLKANISTIVGSLYDQSDIRRDPAFTIFYMGINLGAALGALIAGYLGQTYGWSYGFGAAGVGMVLGLIVFTWGKPLLAGRGEPPSASALKEKVGGLSREVLIYIGAFAGVIVTWQLLQHQQVVGWLLALAGAVVVGYILFTSTTQLQPVERDRIIVALLLMGFSILFWALFEQAGSSLNVFADERIERSILGIEVPASVFQSLNAIYIVLLGPIFAALWMVLAKRGLEPSTPAKFGLALMQLGLGFLVLVFGAQLAGEARTPLIWLFLIYLLHTMGELCLSPVGLSAMTKLAIPRMVGLIMGTWFLASAAGNFVSGLIAKATGGGEDIGSDQVMGVYTTVGWAAIAVGVGVIVISPLIRRMMHIEPPLAAAETAAISPVKNA